MLAGFYIYPYRNFAKKFYQPPFCRMFLIASSALKGEVANNKKVGNATVI